MMVFIFLQAMFLILMFFVAFIADPFLQKKSGFLFRFSLQKIHNIGWHLFNRGVVELLDVIESTFIFVSNEVDSYPFTSETTAASDSVEKRGNAMQKLELIRLYKIIFEPQFIPMNVILSIRR